MSSRPVLGLCRRARQLAGSRPRPASARLRPAFAARRAPLHGTAAPPAAPGGPAGAGVASAPPLWPTTPAWPAGGVGGATPPQPALTPDGRQRVVDPEPETWARTLSTREGYVRLPRSGRLRGYVPDSADAELRGLATVLLSDGRPRTARELEGVRQEIVEYFHRTFTLFEKLHEMFLVSTAFFEKHERLRHPPIFYMGHTASFFVNKLHLGKFITERIDPVLEMQMAVGVDEMSWDDLDTSKYVWPSIEEAEADVEAATAFLQKVMDFRRDVRMLVDREMASAPMEWPIRKESFWWTIMMGIEHERIHLETSSVILRQAKLEHVQSCGASLLPQCRQGRFHADPRSSIAKSTPTNRLLPVAAGATRLGRTWEGTSTYGWDNEFGALTMREVPAFAASELLVSNFEFLAFVEAGGYSTQRWWSDEGWQWASDMKPTAPRFWRAQKGGGYHLRTLFEEVPMPWDWPVECSHHEAAAFCRYLSEKTGRRLRLPAEDESMRLRDTVATDLQDSAHGPAWGAEAPGNINLAHWASPCPVDTFRSPAGFCDVLGNVWQHSASPIDVLDGFATHPLYEDFTLPTVDGLHSRIMGGSWISTGANGATRDSRYGFRRHFYQHAGFRYVESDREVALGVTPCERERALCNELRFHFDAPPALGREGAGVEEEEEERCFPVRLAAACAEALARAGPGGPRGEQRALELGCGPGRTVLELARLGLGAAHGADLTAGCFRLTAEQLLAGGGAGRLRWANYLEGDFNEHRELAAAELGLSEAALAALQWHQVPDFAAVDARKLRDYDLVVCAQPGALCTSDPLGFLAGAHRLLRPGGLLVVGTQYEWPSAAVGAGSGKEVLEAALGPWFEEALEPQDLPFAKAETARKFECGVQQLSFWRRRAQELPSAAAGAAGTAARSEGAPLAAPSEAAAAHGQAVYDDEAVLGQYLDFHYGPRSEYPAACAACCLEAVRELGVPPRRALEVGAGPGRASLELSRVFGHVDGGDYSAAFVDAARRLLAEGELRWRVPVDRSAGTAAERAASLRELGPGSVSFSQIDAHDLGDRAGYDLVCGFNLLDRLARPRDFLLGAKACLNKGGLLVLSSPYTWLEEFTPKEAWLGGYKYGDNDGPSTYTGLKELLLAEGFKEVKGPQDLWFQIDELGNGRKSQRVRAQMTFWGRM